MAEELFEEIPVSIASEISFITNKMDSIIDSLEDVKDVDIKKQADLHRYAQTRQILVETYASVLALRM